MSCRISAILVSNSTLVISVIGLSKVTSGVSRIKDLLQIRAKHKNTNSTIIFNDKTLTYNKIFTEKIADIVEIEISDIMIDSKIGLYDEIVGNDIPQWYKTFKILIRDDFKSKHILRLHFNVNLLYIHRITMAQISNAIMDNNLDTVICVYSPLNVGILDIYPIENNIIIKDENVVDRVRAFLSLKIYPNLTTFLVKGIEGIKSLFPASRDVWSVVINIDNKGGGNWQLFFNKEQLKVTAMPITRVINLLELLKVRIIENEIDNFIIQMPSEEDAVAEIDYNWGMPPTDYIKKILKNEKKKILELRKNHREELRQHKLRIDKGKCKEEEEEIVLENYDSEIIDTSEYIYVENDRRKIYSCNRSWRNV